MSRGYLIMAGLCAVSAAYAAYAAGGADRFVSAGLVGCAFFLLMGFVARSQSS
jgi:hypothetical protein